MPFFVDEKGAIIKTELQTPYFKMFLTTDSEQRVIATLAQMGLDEESKQGED